MIKKILTGVKNALRLSAVIGCDSGWVDCNKERPRERQQILYADVFGNVGECRYTEWTGYTMNAITINGVTHWRPMPKHPNQGR